MTIAPKLAIGDGAMGFWGALVKVFPQDQEAALLGTQDSQCFEQSAKENTAQSKKGVA
jgi:hypothetical protein